MKDYYDLYFFVNYRWDSIDKEILSYAIIRTFSARNSITELRNIRETIKTLENNPFLNRLWTDYSQKHEYSKNVSFNDTIKAIEIIEETIFSNNEIKLSVHTSKYSKITRNGLTNLIEKRYTTIKI